MHYGMPCKLLKVLFYVRFDFVKMQAENLDRVEGWGKKLWRQEWTDWQPFHSRRRDEEGKGKRKDRSGFNCELQLYFWFWSTAVSKENL